MPTIITASTEYAAHNGHECDIKGYIKAKGKSRVFAIVDCECGTTWLTIPAKDIMMSDVSVHDALRRVFRRHKRGSKPAIWARKIKPGEEPDE